MKLSARQWLIHGSLFAVTLITTTVAGAFYANDKFDSILPFLLRGWVFSVPLMAILLTHEMGHYLSGRRHHLDVSLPYFIPFVPYFPLPGTMGAFIRIRSPIPDRQTLMEVGACGPIAGSLVAIPMLVLGMAFSEFRPVNTPATGLFFGSSIILELFSLIRFGHFTSDGVVLHPTAWAAWFGLFVTAMNLLPIGQLDGGHVIYALFGPRLAGKLSIIVFALLILCGILLWPGWFVFALFLTFLLGLRHPPPLDPYVPLERSGYLLGWLAIILFVLAFIPVPISVIE